MPSSIENQDCGTDTKLFDTEFLGIDAISDWKIVVGCGMPEEYYASNVYWGDLGSWQNRSLEEMVNIAIQQGHTYIHFDSSGNGKSLLPAMGNQPTDLRPSTKVFTLIRVTDENKP